MTIPLLLLALGLVVLVVGADLLVRGAAGLALRLGLGPLVIGLTIVAFGTSAPELAVSIRAGLAGSPGIAFGNIIGSNTMNVAVILGVSAMICPLTVHLQIVRREMPLMLAATVVFIVMLELGDGLGLVEALVLLAVGVAYTVATFVMAKSQPLAAEAIGDVAPPRRGTLPLQVALVVAGLGMLIGGAQLLVDNSVTLATALGMSPAAIGVTIVAAGTSMPELVTSIVAAFRKQTDIAVGNIVGSNLFNLLFIGGATGITAPGAKGGLGWIDLGFMLGTSLLLLPLMITGFTLRRWEGALLFSCYLAYLVLVWPSG